MQDVGIDITFRNSGAGITSSHGTLVETYSAAARNDINLFVKWMTEGRGLDHFDDAFDEDSFLVENMFEPKAV